MNKHSFITILLTVLISMIGAKAFAHDIAVANDDGVTIYYKWVNNNTELAVSYQGSSSSLSNSNYSGNIVIPSSVVYNGNTYNVTSIGSEAFYDCRNLTSVTIPNNVTSIGREAFYDCRNLTSVTIPNSVTSIGSSAFYNTGWYNNHVNGLLYLDKWLLGYKGNQPSGELNIAEGTKGIAGSAFISCSGLTSVTIPNSVTYIGEFSFQGCRSLTSVTIPNSVTSISRYAFQGSGWYNNQANGLLYLDKWLLGYKGNQPSGELNIAEGTKGIAGSAFISCSGLTSVTIPNSVTYIGEQAFISCSGLTSVTIPNSVTYIGEQAFQSCSSLTSITIGSSVTSIGSEAFRNCNVLSSFKVENGNEKYDSRNNCNAIIETSSNTLIIGCNNSTIPNSVTSIGGSAFHGCTTLTSITIPNSVTSIGSYAFSYCWGLTSVTIPNSVTSIGSSAFYNCSGLTSVTIPNSVTSIGDHAFYGCSGLTSVTIPNSVTYIGEQAFQSCSSLTSITIPNSVTSIGRETFYRCSSLSSVIIGSGVLSIGYNAFNGTNLKKTIWLTNTPPSGYSEASGAINYVSNDQFKISNKVVYKYLSSYFVVDGIRYVPVSPSDRTCDAIDCTYDASVENINIGETVTNKGITLTVKKVNSYTCYRNKNIKDVNLSLGGDIGDYAFYGCNGLNTATISNNGAIGESAFKDCPALITATIGNQGGIGNYAFSGCSLLETADLGKKIPSIGNYAFEKCTKLKSIVIPDAVTTLGSYAFHYCSAMTSVKIGNGVETINQYAFSGCSSLLSVAITSAVMNIQDYAFNNCTSLANVTIDDSETTLTLGSNGSSPIFSSCPLDYVYIGRDISYQTGSSKGYSPFYRNTTLRAVKITEKETEISANEFYGCTNLQRVIIGDGVTNIGNWAFSGCSSLEYFAFGSQMANIGQDAFSDCTALVEINSKAKVPPVCGSQALDDINKWECKLYVPKDCLPAYEAADQWKDFFFKEEGTGTLLQPVMGDANDDGKINIADIVEMVNTKNNKASAYFNYQNADMDGNSVINQADIDAVVNIIMNQE